MAPPISILFLIGGIQTTLLLSIDIMGEAGAVTSILLVHSMYSKDSEHIENVPEFLYLRTFNFQHLESV